MKDYEKMVESLFERHTSVQSSGFTPGAYKPGLERMEEFDRILGAGGLPLSRRLRFIHVAGTNGKGSVCHMIASSLAAEGMKIGLYTSPHLVDFRERVRIVTDEGVKMIPKKDCAEFLTSYEDAYRNLSFFEITTGMALWYFERAGVDFVVFETGLGGRLDSTNIVTPAISIITSIGLDHCAILGGTRPLIAAEKAGIFKKGVPSLVGERDSETEPVFREKAALTGALLHFADEFPAPQEMKMDLEGDYQQANLRTVFAALRILGHNPDPEAISHAAARTGLRGRWESVKIGGYDAIMDIGHNEPALRHNFSQLEKLVGPSAKYRKLIVVYGVMADKDLEAIIPLMPDDAYFIFTAPSTPRALPSGEILRRFRASGRKEEAVAVSGVKSALKEAIWNADDATLIYIGGSAFVVADAISSKKMA